MNKQEILEYTKDTVNMYTGHLENFLKSLKEYEKDRKGNFNEGYYAGFKKAIETLKYYNEL